jgi:uncharacterized protein (DUF433 family)
MPKIVHPHITNDPAVCGRRAVIQGTRFSVRSIVIYVLQHGCTPEELVTKFPHLSLAQVHDALAYDYDNRSEIDREIAENREEYARSQRPS